MILLAAAAAAPIEPIDYRLAPPHGWSRPCPAVLAEIVVCGTRRQPDRLAPIAGPAFTDDPVEAKLRLSGGTSLQVHATPGLDGTTRAMITWSLRF